MARSQSAAGVARPARARSKSPRRSLSPPADRDGWRYTGAAPAPNDSTHQSLSRNPTTDSRRRPELVSDWSVDVEMTAGLDPARNTVVETRTFFGRVRSSPLYCHLLFHLLALFHFGFVSRIFRYPRPYLPDMSTLSIMGVCYNQVRCILILLNCKFKSIHYTNKSMNTAHLIN